MDAHQIEIVRRMNEDAVAYKGRQLEKGELIRLTKYLETPDLSKKEIDDKITLLEIVKDQLRIDLDSAQELAQFQQGDMSIRNMAQLSIMLDTLRTSTMSYRISKDREITNAQVADKRFQEQAHINTFSQAVIAGGLQKEKKGYVESEQAAQRESLSKYRVERRKALEKMKRDLVDPTIQRIRQDKGLDAATAVEAFSQDGLFADSEEKERIVGYIDSGDYDTALEAIKGKFKSPGTTLLNVFGYFTKNLTELDQEKRLLDDGSYEAVFKRKMQRTEERMRRRVEQSNPLSRILLERTQSLFHGTSITAERGREEYEAAYNPEFKKIKMDLYGNETALEGMDGTIFHEMAHMSDNTYSESVGKDITDEEIQETYKKYYCTILPELKSSITKLQEKYDKMGKMKDKSLKAKISDFKHTAWLIENSHIDDIMKDKTLFYRMKEELERLNIDADFVRSNEISAGKMKEQYYDALHEDFKFFFGKYCRAAFSKSPTSELMSEILEKQVFNTMVLPTIIADENNQVAIEKAMEEAVKKQLELKTLSVKEQQEWLIKKHPLLTPKGDSTDACVGGVCDIFKAFLLDSLSDKNDALSRERESPSSQKEKRILRQIGIMERIRGKMTIGHPDDYYRRGRYIVNIEAWAEMTEAESGGSELTRLGYMQYMPNAFSVFKDIRRRAVLRML